MESKWLKSVLIEVDSDATAVRLTFWSFRHSEFCVLFEYILTVVI